MDYEVFILSHMREEHDRTGSTDQAVIQGLGRTVVGALIVPALVSLMDRANWWRPGRHDRVGPTVADGGRS